MTNISAHDFQKKLELAFTQATPTMSEGDIARVAEKTVVEVLVSLKQLPEDSPRRIDDILGGGGAAFAVPDDALDLVPTLIGVAISALSGEFFSGAGELVAVLYKYHRAGVEITSEEAAVLRALARAKKDNRGPLAPPDVEDIAAKGGQHLSQSVRIVLETLFRKNTSGATLVTVTEGRWAIGNV